MEKNLDGSAACVPMVNSRVIGTGNICRNYDERLKSTRARRVYQLAKTGVPSVCNRLIAYTCDLRRPLALWAKAQTTLNVRSDMHNLAA